MKVGGMDRREKSGGCAVNEEFDVGMVSVLTGRSMACTSLVAAAFD